MQIKYGNQTRRLMLNFYRFIDFGLWNFNCFLFYFLIEILNKQEGDEIIVFYFNYLVMKGSHMIVLGR